MQNLAPTSHRASVSFQIAPASEGNRTSFGFVLELEDGALAATRSWSDCAMRSLATEGGISNGSCTETSIGVFVSEIVEGNGTEK